MDLPSLLRHAEHNGMYHLPPGGLDGLASAATAAGLLFAHCDLKENPALEAALETIGAAFGFPDWYGANLDALHDCLTDFSWQDTTGWAALLTGADALRAGDAEGYAGLKEVLAAAADYWREQEVPFWVFVDLRADGLADLPTIG